MAVGALFITATVVAILSMLVLGDGLQGEDYLLSLSAKRNDVLASVASETILAASLVVIGALMFPVLKGQGEGLALGYACFRLMEAVFITMGTVCLLLMLALGEGFASGNFQGQEEFGALLSGAREWSILFGTMVFLGAGGLLLNSLLWIGRLVPRWLSAWGLVGASFILAYGALVAIHGGMTEVPQGDLLAIPILVQEMAFAGWLIIRGFRPKEGVVGQDTG